jgi:hypothetical protein
MRIRPDFLDWQAPKELGLSLTEEILVWKLLRAGGEVSRSDCFDALICSPFSFAEDEHSGVVKVTISHIRKKFEPYGLRVTSTNHRNGCRQGTYSIPPLDRERLLRWRPATQPKPMNGFCQKINYRQGGIDACGKPSGEHPYCEGCRQPSMLRAPKFHGGLRTNRSEAA